MGEVIVVRRVRNINVWGRQAGTTTVMYLTKNSKYSGMICNKILLKRAVNIIVTSTKSMCTVFYFWIGNNDNRGNENIWKIPPFFSVLAWVWSFVCLRGNAIAFADVYVESHATPFCSFEPLHLDAIVYIYIQCLSSHCW